MPARGAVAIPAGFPTTLPGTGGYIIRLSVAKKSFRHAVRILKLSKKVSKSCLIERAVGFLPPAHTPPLLCRISLLRGFQQSGADI